MIWHNGQNLISNDHILSGPPKTEGLGRYCQSQM
jgi:hypothetical protein